MLEALKVGYPTLYARSEYAHTMPKEKLKELVIEVTGLERDNSMVTAIVGTFQALKAIGGVGESTKTSAGAVSENPPAPIPEPPPPALNGHGERRNGQTVGMNLYYTTFGELGDIIRANEPIFGDTFKDLKAVSKVMFNLNTLRGPIAHCSPLAEDEVLRLQLSMRDWFRLMS